jgi:hypothetical protein
MRGALGERARFMALMKDKLPHCSQQRCAAS